jgi:hypothetical protein
MKRHYHVFVSMPGYLPDNEPEVYRTRKQAEIAAKWYADAYRDMVSYGPLGPVEDIPYYRITGSARSGCYTIDRGEYTLPIYITIEPCTDRVCADEYAEELS